MNSYTNSGMRANAGYTDPSAGMGGSSSGASREMKQRLSGMKNEIAGSMNIDLGSGYNGDISARDAGRIGGQMVKRMIEFAERSMSGSSNMNGGMN